MMEKYTKIDPEPMNIYEAIEAMKIIAPVAPVLLQNRQSGVMLLRSLVEELEKRQPTDVIRLIAYMFHVNGDEVINDLEELGAEGIAAALAKGIKVNAIPDLINAAYFLGICSVRWIDG